MEYSKLAVCNGRRISRSINALTCCLASDEFNRLILDKIIECARKQIDDAGTDLVIANDISKDDCHFGSDNNEVLIVDSEVLTVPLASKKEIAKSIFDVISEKI